MSLAKWFPKPEGPQAQGCWDLSRLRTGLWLQGPCLPTCSQGLAPGLTAGRRPAGGVFGAPSGPEADAATRPSREDSGDAVLISQESRGFRGLGTQTGLSSSTESTCKRAVPLPRACRGGQPAGQGPLSHRPAGPARKATAPRSEPVASEAGGGGHIPAGRPRWSRGAPVFPVQAQPEHPPSRLWGPQSLSAVTARHPQLGAALGGT